MSGGSAAPASLLSAPVLLVCMPAARESERTGTLTFELFLFNSLELSGVGGEGVSTSLYSQRRRFWYAYQQTRRANVRNIFFLHSRRSTLTAWVGGGKVMLAALTLGGALGMHASGKKNERAEIVHLLCFHCSLLTDLVGEGKGMPASLHSQVGRFRYSCQRIGRVRDSYSRMRRL